jgi:hypothetical protein
MGLARKETVIVATLLLDEHAFINNVGVQKFRQFPYFYILYNII